MCPRGRSRGQGRPRGLHLWLQHTTGIRRFILHAEIRKRIKIQQIFVKTLFFVFCFFLAPQKLP